MVLDAANALGIIPCCLAISPIPSIKEPEDDYDFRSYLRPAALKRFLKGDPIFAWSPLSK
jgi:hypothetical protein